MPLSWLRVERFRCLDETELLLDPSVNLFFGPNASGKTSLLEAAFFLGRGRSFRTRRRNPLIQHGESNFLVAGRCTAAHGEISLGIRASPDSAEIHVNGRAVRSTASLVEVYPTQALDPDVHKLVEEGPARRRRFLDWGVFHVEPEFLSGWHRYHLALRNRNAALNRGLGRSAVAAWDQEVGSSGERLAEQRGRYLERLAGPLSEIGRSPLGAEITLKHLRGWSDGVLLVEQLGRAIAADERNRATTIGPHRADLVIYLGDREAKGIVSRGQQKLLAAGLLLAQLRVQQEGWAGPGALMLDDPAAELDERSLEKLMGIIGMIRTQLWVSSLTGEVPGLPGSGKRFHVERGVIREVR
ncbi:MAG: DNA replication and repair protein RecF [Gammaproteobacteria bacterium]|nr:DNA replication and repair protein RecF [Gammaproteobacteria bacterium]